MVFFNIIWAVALCMVNLVTIYIIIWFIKDKIKMQKRIEELQSQNMLLMLKMRQYTISRRNFDNKKANSDDLIDAVKFAMIQAHPDNPNGNKDRFIRYRKLYDYLKE